jgi:hypothetical protein
MGATPSTLIFNPPETFSPWRQFKIAPWMGVSILISEHASVRPTRSILLPELAHKNNPPVTNEDSRKKERLFIFYDLIVDC